MSGGDFLSRWSRRKRAPVPSAPVPESGPPLESFEDAGHRDPPPLPDGDTLSPDELAKLPSLDSFTAETDLTQFLRAGVPLMLRKAALRRMWSVDAGIRDYVSEAREYAYDWNAVGGVPGSGPMLPTDDIKAMLRDIFDGTPVAETTPSETLEAPRDADEALPVADREGEDIAVLEAADPQPAIVGTESETSQAMPVARARSDFPPAPRPRRHGGAMPL